MSCIYESLNNICSIYKEECSYPCKNFTSISSQSIFPEEYDEFLKDILAAYLSARHFDIDIRTETLVDMYKYLKRLGYKRT